ncbi:TetR/AcrR family transcriptional regulator [Desulfatibacillum aliphaticivorans]|uniref:TetR/AcrR family transcriptional regulator n=1 Tax=Desulfatibacillum aliphaticivorans TaxID=218208 RepID=UPI0004012207|nr:TetR/AcrR family transcriptional regulator [Desulfatibacillum aliphaticivorans]
MTGDDRSTNNSLMKNETKEKILQHGARLVYQKGFNHTGIGEILKAAKVPKGSFYHYFPSKEDFGLELLDYMAVWAASVGIAALYDKSYTPLERLKNFFQAYEDNFERMNYTGGCPVGNLCLEMSDQSDPFREKLEKILEQMRRGIAKVLEEAVKAREVPEDLSVEATAHFIISAWQGTLLQTKVMKNGESIQVFKRIVFEQLLQNRQPL